MPLSDPEPTDRNAARVAAAGARPGSGRSGRTRHRLRGPRIATLLAIVAVVPVAGIVTLAVDDLRSADQEHDRAHQVAVTAATTVELARLDAAVGEERNWSVIHNVARTVGGTDAQFATLLGSNPDEEMARSRAEVDRLLGRLAVPRLDALVRSARAPELDYRGMISAYDAAAAAVADPLASAIDSIRTVDAGRDDEQRQISRASLVLQDAVAMRRDVAAMIEGYYATIFDVRGTPADEMRRLIAVRSDYDEVVIRLHTEVAPQPEMAAGLVEVTTSRPMADLLGAVDQLLVDSVANELPPAGRPVDATVATSPAAAGVTTVFRTSGVTTQATMKLVGLSGRSVTDATTLVEKAADAELRTVMLRSVAFVLLSLMAAVAGAALIGRPLRRLQVAADALRDGGEGSFLPSGPVEVRAAGAAINDASAHLELLTAQTEALAGGDLDAAVLDESAPGGLGEAVQRAVRTLRAALTQQDEFRQRLAHEAAHDGLTQLPNRNASLAQLGRSLARAQRSGTHLAVLFIDLDHFKDVNDEHGHQAGDLVLSTITERLVANVREGDHVGRLGGDEFVVIAEPVGGIDEATALAERLVDAVDQPIDVGGVRVSVGASVGVALADDTTLTPDELLRDADLAVYRAKANERGGVEVCDEDLRAELAHAADLTAALHSAIDHDEFVLHFQPIVEADAPGTLHALEALVRWQRPGEDRLVMPDRFIDHAERSALIVEIDRWVIRAVARQIARWKSDGVYDGTPVAINVSGRHLAHDHFVQHVLQPFRDVDVDPCHVIVEVTESALLDDLGAAAVKLEQLRDRGIAVAIDDFGTGYTSLAHLRSLPVDILKIDRSFTAASSDEDEASIVKLIIDTGHLLGASITAEGVETDEEAMRLTALGSDALQGYRFARPAPAWEIRFGSQLISRR